MFVMVCFTPLRFSHHYGWSNLRFSEEPAPNLSAGWNLALMQWHLGTLRNDSVRDCYPAANQSSSQPDCLPGYVGWSNGDEALCCQGNDGRLMLNHPLHHGTVHWIVMVAMQ